MDSRSRGEDSVFPLEFRHRYGDLATPSCVLTVSNFVILCGVFFCFFEARWGALSDL